MSMELIIISVAVLSLFITLFAIIDYRNNEIDSVRDYLEAKDMADSVSWSINEACVSGFGTLRSLDIINETKSGTTMLVEVYPQSRFVKASWGESFYTSPLVTSRVTADINGNTSYNITLIGGAMNITNSKGEIQLVQ